MADVTLTITIPDAHVQEVSQATGATTKAQFQDWVKDRIKEAVKEHRVNTAIAEEEAKLETAIQARQQAIDAVEAGADITLQ